MNEGPHFSNRDRRGSEGLRDDDLHDRFASLRREDAHRVPEFARLWRNRARVPRGKGRRVVVVACVLIVMLAIFWLRSVQRRPHDVAVASIAEWNSPTDFLLETPGRELLRTVPEIGEWRGYIAPAATGRSAPLQKKF